MKQEPTRQERIAAGDAAAEALSKLVPTIKPIHCPFCGPGMSQVEVYFDFDNSRRWRVGCGACGTHSGHSHRDKHPDDATKRWNTRPLGE